jgi:hypothetical protein
MEDLMVNAAPALSLLLIAALAAPVALASAVGQRPGDDNTLYVVLPRDAIPAISKPEFEPASAARLSDNELVIGVVGEREQRAYSTWQLDRHEIVNDVFEGRPIAVTW